MAGGWFARSACAVASFSGECSTSGFLLVPTFLELEGSGDAEQARAVADRIVEIAARCRRPGSVRARTSLPGRGGGRARRARARHAVLRRRHGVGHDRRGLAPARWNRLLRGHRGVHGRLRPAASRASGPMHSPRGARGNRSSCPTGASASSTGHRSSRPAARGTTPWPPRRTPTETSPTPTTRRSAPRCTSSVTCTGSAGSMQPPSAAYRARADRDGSRHPASRCCGSRRGTSPRRSRRSNVSSKRRRGQRCHAAMLAAAVEILLAAGDAGHGAAPRRGAREARRPFVDRSSSRRSPRTPSARSLLAEGERRGARIAAPRHARGLAPTRRCRTTPPAPRVRSPAPAGRSPTTTPPPRARRALARLREPRRAHRPGPGGPARRCDRVAAGRADRPRQCDVLRVVATGMSNREVGGDPRHQRAHRRPSPPEHLRQARVLVPCRGHRLRPPARSGLTATRGESTWCAWSERTTRVPAALATSGDADAGPNFVRSDHDDRDGDDPRRPAADHRRPGRGDRSPAPGPPRPARRPRRRRRASGSSSPGPTVVRAPTSSPRSTPTRTSRRPMHRSRGSS